MEAISGWLFKRSAQSSIDEIGNDIDVRKINNLLSFSKAFNHNSFTEINSRTLGYSESMVE